jgi:hypothetical protein
MNSFRDEQTDAYYRQRIQQEIKQIRLERLATKSQPYKPGRFERTMFNFANWMISTGKQLRKRYEVPVSNCNDSRSKGFAH